MPTLTIRHLTTYRYRQPVAFGEHRMMLRPRDSERHRVIEARLTITPEPLSLRHTQDDYGNHVGIAEFSRRSRVLSFESVVCVEHAPHLFIAVEDATPVPEAGFDRDADPDPVGAWALGLLPADGAIGSWALLTRLSERIHNDFTYRRREAMGIQTPAETIELGSGTCRDFAVLLIDVARRFGFAARFASGYLAVPLTREAGDGPETGHGSTHAWAEVHLPRLGWVAFDPTNGSVGGHNLITVAVTTSPEEATPLYGSFLGFPSDHIGLDVAVSITPGPIAP
ncbi:transglutaminase family protein [Dongia sedimenti]|uniref:Transglutaminase family protein n=1 Tax=Dongia sedimenti TaxID=3064282 RepID=A0ABU0YMC2_9PROT|nr:transglutaminase family protein [Rhodospirillaceae bacterium R-7]